MIDIDKIEEIYQTLKKNKLRTLMTAFGVFWGIFMLIIMLGSGQGLENGIRKSFSGIAANSFFVWSQNTSMSYKGMPKNRFIQFKNEDFEVLKKAVPEVSVIVPSNQLGGYRGENNVVRNNKTGAFTVRGDYPETIRIQTLKLEKGRYINANDMQDVRKVCVIGKRVYQVLFPDGENPIGEHIQINGVYFKVVGMFTTDKGDEDAQEKMQMVLIPFSTFQKAFNFGNRIEWFSMLADSGVSASLAEEKVRACLSAIHRIHPDDRRAIGSWNTEKEFKRIMGLFTGISILVWVVGIGTLLAGAIGVSNIMLIIIKERTKEIGIRRAIGASPASIISQIMLESVAITLLSGYLGLVAGVFLLELVNSLLNGGDGMFLNPGVDLQVALKALLILVFAGLLAGIIPAQRALRIKPVEALRDE